MLHLSVPEKSYFKLPNFLWEQEDPGGPATPDADTQWGVCVPGAAALSPTHWAFMTLANFSLNENIGLIFLK